MPELILAATNLRIHPTARERMELNEPIRKRFGRFTVLIAARNSSGQKAWLCRCDCGQERIVRLRQLESGRSNSCGCIGANTRHGKKGSRVYAVWQGMLDRTRRPGNKAYKNYGGRGIQVSESWLTFENFYRDMGDPPEGMSLDRINNDAGYSKENCRWATRTEQSRNRRNNKWLTANGKRMTITDWSRVTGMQVETIKARLTRGWSEERAVTVPPRSNWHKTG